MSSGDYDVIIFGATGVAGRMVMEDMFEVHKLGLKLKWGIAGRNKDKLKKLLDKTASSKGQDASQVSIFQASCEDPDSLDSICKNTKVLINVAGPYYKLEYAVMEACIENSCHYIDCSSESEYQEIALIRYGELAKSKNLYIVLACGFYSFIFDLAVCYLKDNYKGTLNNISSFYGWSANNEGISSLSMNAWDSFVADLGGSFELKTLQTATQSRLIPPPRYDLEKRSIANFDETIKRWYIAESDSNVNVILKSQKTLSVMNGEVPVMVNCYSVTPNFIMSYIIYFLLAFVHFVSQFKFMKYYCLKYYTLFSLGMVTEKEPTRSGKTEFHLVGKGWDAKNNMTSPPTKTKVLHVFAPFSEYAVTSTSLVCSAVMLIENKNLPVKGGVYTPAAAFRNANYVEHLKAFGISLDLP